MKYLRDVGMAQSDEEVHHDKSLIHHRFDENAQLVPVANARASASVIVAAPDAVMRPQVRPPAAIAFHVMR